MLFGWRLRRRILGLRHTNCCSAGICFFERPSTIRLLWSPVQRYYHVAGLFPFHRAGRACYHVVTGLLTLYHARGHIIALPPVRSLLITFADISSRCRRFAYFLAFSRICLLFIIRAEFAIHTFPCFDVSVLVQCRVVVLNVLLCFRCWRMFRFGFAFAFGCCLGVFLMCFVQVPSACSARLLCRACLDPLTLLP